MTYPALFRSGPNIPGIASRLSNSVTSLHAWLKLHGTRTANKCQHNTSNAYPTREVLLTPSLLVTADRLRLLASTSNWEYFWTITSPGDPVLHLTKKVSRKIGALPRASQRPVAAKRTFYLSVIASDLEYGSNAFFSSLSSTSKVKFVQLPKRGARAIFGASPWEPSLLSTSGTAHSLES